MKKYYCLQLNNCYDIDKHYISNFYDCTMLPAIIDKELSDISNLEEEFMNLDYMITENYDNYHIYGKFPVIGEEINDEIYDIITGKKISKSLDGQDINGLSYNKKYEANKRMMELILALLDKESTKRYIDYLNNIERYSQTIYSSKNISETEYQTKLNETNQNIIVKSINDGGIIELYTSNRIYPINNVITSELTCQSLKPLPYYNKITDFKALKTINGLAIYKYSIKFAKKSAIINYHNYISSHKDKPKKRIKTIK